MGVPVSPYSRRAGRQYVLVRLLLALRHATRCCFLGRTWAQVAAGQENAPSAVHKTTAQRHCKHTILRMQSETCSAEQQAGSRWAQ